MLACLKTSRWGKVGEVGYESHYDPALLEKKAKAANSEKSPQLLPGNILFRPENTAVRHSVSS